MADATKYSDLGLVNTRDMFKKAMDGAGPTILEPIMDENTPTRHSLNLWPWVRWRW